jgi:F-type H+-transporting ATPase subunit b
LPNINVQIAASSGGISSLGLNVKAFVFQLITFLIVLGILSKWVFPRLVAILEDRRKVLEEGLEHAKQTEEALKQAEAKSAELLHQAREQADQALADAKNQAKEIVAAAEKAGAQSAERIVKEAGEQLGRERNKLRSELKEELAGLVVQTTEKVLQERMNAKEDLELIRNKIKELQR